MEGQELPVGWVDAPLLGLGELIRGVTYSKNDSSDRSFSGSIPILRANNIQDRHFDTANLVHVPTSLVAQTQIVKAGDVVIATSSGSISVVGKAAQAREDFAMAFGAFCGLIRPSNEISPEYFGHFFSSEYYRTAVSDMARGVNINNLKKSHFESLNIPLPPLNEQHRIAAKLDTTLAAVEACRQRLDGVAAILKRFRQAVLAAATSGELTREWREERGESSWDTKALGECGAVTGGVTKNSSRNDMTLQKPYLRVANVYRNRLELDDIAVIGVTDSEYLKTVLRAGDLLIVEGNGSLQQVGRVAIWQDESIDCVHQNHLIRWRTYEMEPKWALYWLMSPVGRELLEERAQTSTGLHTLSVSKISGIPIAYPSFSEQKQVIHLVGVLFTLADQLEAKLTAARKSVDRLTPALLAKAFRGELVPQDHSDEPANVLLERIRAARRVEAAAGKPSRRGRRKAATNPDQIAMDAAPVPLDFLAGLLRECGALSERALLAVSELEPQRFQQQLYRELESGTAREVQDNGQVLLEAVG